MTEERAPYKVERLKDYHNVAKQMLALADKAAVEEAASCVTGVRSGVARRGRAMMRATTSASAPSIFTRTRWPVFASLNHSSPSLVSERLSRITSPGRCAV